jgi:membrane protease subunit HflK
VRGEAERTVAKGEGYAVQVTRRRLYLETMREILPAVKQVFVFDADQPSSLLPFLNLQQGDNLPVMPSAKEK